MPSGESSESTLTLDNYYLLAADPALPRVIGVTLSIAAWCTLACILLGTPVAYLLSETPSRIAGLLLIAVLLPFWTSLLVRTYAMLLLLQRRGLINEALQSLGVISEPLQLAHNMTGTVIAMTQIMLPYFILPVYASFRRTDRGMMNAAAGLGAAHHSARALVLNPHTRQPAAGCRSAGTDPRPTAQRRTRARCRRP